MKLEHYLADIFRIKRKNLLNKSSSVCVGNRKWHRIGLHLTTWSIQRLSFATNFSHVYSCMNNVDIILIISMKLFVCYSIKYTYLTLWYSVGKIFEFHDIYTSFVNLKNVCNKVITKIRRWQFIWTKNAKLQINLSKFCSVVVTSPCFYFVTNTGNLETNLLVTKKPYFLWFSYEDLMRYLANIFSTFMF